MTTYRKLFFCLLLFALIASFTSHAAAADSASGQINAEIAHLQQSAKDRPITDKDAAQVAGAAEGALKSASVAMNAGQLYLAVEKLGQAEDLLQGARRMDDKAEVEKGGLTAFQA